MVELFQELMNKSIKKAMRKKNKEWKEMNKIFKSLKVKIEYRKKA